ncbi:hypothetical protein Q5P01_001117 [Channa striata]|uniref:Polymeric immunoglobulin receptor-like n=1 Tax=Channa striata TaxID=64152 RepID=A0AA88NP02_CHASR|nr:hypothetical protein Q5P01_001117 [Channa striata]
MMKSFLLLVFSVMAGCETDILACEDGWVEFTCVYPEKQKNYQKIDVVRDRQTITQSTEKNKWEHKGRFSLYHNTTGKYLRVVIKQLKREDFGNYRCKFDPGGKTTERVELKKGNNRCLEPIIKTMNKREKNTIICQNSKHMSRVKFLCKENGFICEDILSTQSSPVSNGSFTLTPTKRGFNVSISDVSSEDAGVYWCGVKPDGNYSVTYRKIQLQVHNPPPTPTRSFTTSVPSVQTTTAPAETDDPPPTSTRSFTTSVPSVQTTTAPAETDVPSETWTTVSSAQLTTVSAGNDAGFGGNVTAGVVCAAVLVVVILLVFIYTLSKRRNKDEKPKNKEDHSYAEIQERPQNKDSGAAMKTVYVTANFPTNPSASTDYSEITFGNVSGEVNGDIYSTVTDNEQPPVYSTVSNPSL